MLNKLNKFQLNFSNYQLRFIFYLLHPCGKWYTGLLTLQKTLENLLPCTVFHGLTGNCFIFLMTCSRKVMKKYRLFLIVILHISYLPGSYIPGQMEEYSKLSKKCVTSTELGPLNVRFLNKYQEVNSIRVCIRNMCSGKKVLF